MSKITTCSVNQDDVDFIKENNMSQSDLLREIIQQKREIIEQFTQTKLKEMQDKIARLSITIQKQADFISSKGLLDEFMQK